jgi:hypothetical protein
MDVGAADVVVLAFGNPLIDGLDSHIHIDGAHPYAKNIDTFWCHVCISSMYVFDC